MADYSPAHASTQNTFEGDPHEICQYENWENEGGASAHCAHSFLGIDGVSLPMSETGLDKCNKSQNSYGRDNDAAILHHVDAVECFIDGGDYDAAYHELQTAVSKFIATKTELDRSMNNTIARLSAPGCQATPPHPAALQLVRLRQTLSA